MIKKPPIRTFKRQGRCINRAEEGMDYEIEIGVRRLSN